MNEDTLALLLNPQENDEWFPETDEDWETRNRVVEFYRQVVARLVKEVYNGNVEKAQQDLSNCYRQEGDFGGDIDTQFAGVYAAELFGQELTDEVVWVPLLDTLCVREVLRFNDETELEQIFF